MSAIKWTQSQQLFFKDALKGKNVFLTGIAGSGKSFCLRHLLKQLKTTKKGYKIGITASTGISAIQIAGETLHSWAGIGKGIGSKEYLLKAAQKSKKKKNWLSDILIIDEISMIHKDLFDSLDFIGKRIRNSSLPFGGIQVIVCGDFAQLPPIVGPEQRFFNQSRNARFAFQGKAWEKCFASQVYLQETFRQDDARFIDVLNDVRVGKVPKDLTELVASKSIITQGTTLITKLYSTRANVSEENLIKLNQLPGPKEVFEADDRAINRNYETALKKNATFPEKLFLKKGALVILLQNLPDKVLVNGSKGIVTRIEKHNQAVYVKFEGNNKESKIEHALQSIELEGEVMASRRQIPLSLAWALTMHKSQGMTLSNLQVDLGNCFEYGQAYSALSRATDMKTLKIINFNPYSIKADPEVVRFYKNLESLTKRAALPASPEHLT